MPAKDSFWQVLLADAAAADISNILVWTADRFGERQSKIYIGTVYDALEALEVGPDIPGVKTRDDLPEGILVLHAARLGRRARHLILFRAERTPGRKTIQVLRILHDAMDILRHVTDDDEAGR